MHDPDTYVIFRAALPTGGRLELVARPDGQFHILRDAGPLPGHTWPDADLQAAVAAFRRLVAAVPPVAAAAAA
jgi:hypothetical protein